MTRRAALKPLLSVATLVLVLGLAEAGSYLWATAPERPSPLRTNDDMRALSRFDPLLFWSLRPNSEVAGIRTNSLGLRGPEVPEAEPGETRILSLGESTTFGWKLPVEQSYSSLIERRLAQAGKGGRVRIVNAGIPGYTLFQGYQYLVHRGAALRPNVVLLYFGYNDFLPVSYLAKRVRATGRNDWSLFEFRRRPLRRLLTFLIDNSNLLRLAVSWRERGAPVAEVASDDEKVRVPEAQRSKILSMFRVACEEIGCELVVVVPWYREFEKHVDVLRDFAQQSGVALIDLPTLLPASLDFPRSSYFQDKIHPTAQGHELIADAIYQWLSSRNP